MTSSPTPTGPPARRPLLQVALEPFTATWMSQRLSEEWWVQQIGPWERAGRQDLADALRRDRARLAEAALQWSERARDSQVPTVGTSEVPTSGDQAPLGDEDVVSIAEAAEVLGVSGEMVRRMCRDDLLEARRLHSRRWVVARASVDALAAVRRSA